MNLKFQNLKNLEIVLLFSFFGLLYLFVFNNNSTNDAWAYAASVKFGKDLFNPHHLLYNPFFYILTNFIKQFYNSLDVLRFMKFTNGLFTVLALLTLFKTLKLSNLKLKQTNMWIFFVGSSFAVLRYGTENETYIIPIYFSLLSSFFYYKYSQVKSKVSYVLLSGVFASIACLFHQIQIFWLLGIFLGFILTKNFKHIVLFISTTLIIPITYIAIFISISNNQFNLINLFRFVLRDYYTPSANTTIDGMNFILTPISFFRSFFQVHGIIIDFILSTPIISSSVILIVIYFLRKSFFYKKISLKDINKINNVNKIHLGIFMAQLIFAFISDGNAEFMVMLPFLISIVLPFYFEINYKSIRYLSIAMILWNMSFAIIPNHIYDYYNNNELIKIIDNNPDKIFLLKEKNKIINQYFYQNGKSISNRVFGTTNELRCVKNERIYTDILSKKMPFSRVKMIEDKDEFKFTLVQHREEIISFLGNYYIDEIKIDFTK